MVRRYALRSPIQRVVVRLTDALGDLVAAHSARPACALERLERVLVVRLDHLGDVISTLPLLRRLAALPVPPHITVATSSAAAPLLRDVPWVSERLVWDAPWFRRSAGKASNHLTPLQFVRSLRQRRFDLAIDPRGDARHLLGLALAKIPCCAGFAPTGLGFLLHRELEWRPGRHVVDESKDLADALGLPSVDSDMPRLPWTPTPDERQWLAAQVGGAPYIVFHVAAGTPAKRWPLAHWGRLARDFAELRVVLVGQEAPGPHASETGLAGAVDLRGRTTLPELLTLLKGAVMIVSTDSGPAHMAAALGRPTFVIWSGTNEPTRWLPRGAHVGFARHDVSCQPCGLEGCARERHYCMEDLDAQQVAEGARALLRTAPETTR